MKIIQGLGVVKNCHPFRNDFSTLLLAAQLQI